MEESWPLEYLEAEFLELLPEEDEKGKIDFGAICPGIGEFIGKFACLYGDFDGESLEKAWAEKWHAEVKINRRERTGDDYKLIENSGDTYPNSGEL